MNKQGFVGVFLIVLFLTVASVYWLQLGGAYFVAIRDGVYLLPPFTAFIAGLFALTSYGLKGFRSRTILLITLGMGCWFIGEFLWNYYEYFLHANPFPSFADVFYLAAYPLIFTGLWNEIANTHVTWKQIPKALTFLFGISAILLSAIVLYFGVYQAYDATESLFANSIAMGYGIGDLLLILVSIVILILVWEFRGGKIVNAWMSIFIGLIFTLIADILFAIYTDPYKAQVFLYKSTFDTFWMIGYLCFANALFSIGIFSQDARDSMVKKSKKLTS